MFEVLHFSLLTGVFIFLVFIFRLQCHIRWILLLYFSSMLNFWAPHILCLAKSGISMKYYLLFFLYLSPLLFFFRILFSILIPFFQQFFATVCSSPLSLFSDIFIIFQLLSLSFLSFLFFQKMSSFKFKSLAVSHQFVGKADHGKLAEQCSVKRNVVVFLMLDLKQGCV